MSLVVDVRWLITPTLLPIWKLGLPVEGNFAVLNSRLDKLLAESDDTANRFEKTCASVHCANGSLDAGYGRHCSRDA